MKGEVDVNWEEGLVLNSEHRVSEDIALDILSGTLMITPARCLLYKILAQGHRF